MLSSLKLLYKHQQFQPRWYSIVINPYYFIRRGLFLSIKYFAKQLPKGKLLDFGCGSKPYRDLFDVQEYIGLDMENPGHSHVNEEVDVFYDGNQIPFPDNHFDALLCSEVLEHVFEIDLTLKEIHRVLKPGAKGLISVPFVWNEHEIPNDYGRYSIYGLTWLFQKHGFRILEYKKTTHFFETIMQMGIVYIYQLLTTKSKFFNLVVCIAIIFPLNLIALPFVAVMPRKKDFYHNIVALVEKQ